SLAPASMVVLLQCPIFFFSSRRRHTRFSRDWSSDVCSSDLQLPAQEPRGGRGCRGPAVENGPPGRRGSGPAWRRLFGAGGPYREDRKSVCRERVEVAGVGVAVEKKTGRAGVAV